MSITVRRIRKDLLQGFTRLLLPTCPRCGEATLVWARMPIYKLQHAHCEECDLIVSVQYDDNEYQDLGPEGRKRVWAL